MASRRLLAHISQAAKSSTSRRLYSMTTAASPSTSPFAPRHLLSIADLSPKELTTLIRNAVVHKSAIKSGVKNLYIQKALSGQSVAMTFNKLSTRTRVSTEAAVVRMGGYPMFLGKNDIQLGVNESLYDTSVVISSMVSAWVARVGPHSDIATIAKHSTVPVINALSDSFHPLQILADFLTIHESFTDRSTMASSDLGLDGLKIAWVGDANNVLYDIAIGAAKLGVDVAVATPEGYSMSPKMREVIKEAANSTTSPGTLTETSVPEEAVKAADIIVTDTWVSMGQEEEKAKRIKAFEGFQVTAELAERGGANPGWLFMHCLPRHQEEVSDDVFYGNRSLVFPEAENRLWAAMSAIEGFVVNKGIIHSLQEFRGIREFPSDGKTFGSRHNSPSKKNSKHEK